MNGFQKAAERGCCENENHFHITSRWKAGSGPECFCTCEDDPKPAHDYDPPPVHYATDQGIDPWAVWKAFALDPWEANLVKYILRAGKKEGEPRLKDFKKALNYLQYLIAREEGK